MQYYAASTTPTAHNLDANQPEVLQAQAAVADGDDVVQLNAQGGVLLNISRYVYCFH